MRRQFHTLKGSGRMVGLTELGELAWGVERVLNRLLEEDRRVTPAVVALIGVADSSFRQWVKELRDAGRFATDPAALQSALRMVEAELPGGAPAAAMPLPPVPRTPPIVPETHTPIGPITVAAARTLPARRTPAPGFAPFDLDIGAPIEYPTASAEPPLRAERCRFDGSPTDASLVPDLELVEFRGARRTDSATTWAPTVTVLEESVGETIDVGLPADLRDASKPVLRVVADNTAAHGGMPEPTRALAARTAS